MKFLTTAAFFLIVSTVSVVLRADAPKTLADGPKIPVLAWGGVPYTQATPARYAELANAGFTHNFSGASDIATMKRVLDISHAAGVKQFVSIPELERDPEGTAAVFKDHPGVGGYYLRDEPGAKLFPKLGEWAKRIQSVDSKNPCYVNLFPTYGIPEQWETPTYQAYLDQFIAEVPVPILSFDHYPVYREGNTEAGDRVRPDYYENLELASATARKANRTLWAFALATAHNPYPIATVAHLRLQIFSDLAYGAQALQYFTYWTPKSDVWNFHQGPLDVDGKRTATYDRVRQVNAEAQALRGAFLGSTVLSVTHTGQSLPNGTKRFVPSAPINAFETEGPGAVVSILSKGDRRFLAVVNRDLQKAMPLRISFEKTENVQRIGKDGVLESPAQNCDTKLDPGDVAVFTWNAK
jgi:hypothetical protein